MLDYARYAVWSQKASDATLAEFTHVTLPRLAFLTLRLGENPVHTTEKHVSSHQTTWLQLPEIHAAIPANLPLPPDSAHCWSPFRARFFFGFLTAPLRTLAMHSR